MTDQKAPDGPQERPEGGSGYRAAREAENGPQAGADALSSWGYSLMPAPTAVLPAFWQAGEWLPLLACRAVARASSSN